MNITQPAPRFPRIPASMCSCCGRAITEGYDVPLIGVVGPVCVRKYGPLARVLAQVNDLTVPMTADNELNRAGHMLSSALYHLGFYECRWADNGDGTKTLHLGERTRTKKALSETWERRRARFEADLQIAQGGNGVVKTEWVAA
ncbi:hypothetical protein [Deinococcus cavernae]|nr:hypothetical protein [Deinococcus cavernae]